METKITTVLQATQFAIDWQGWQSEQYLKSWQQSLI
jgi:hypothetical protein